MEASNSLSETLLCITNHKNMKLAMETLCSDAGAKGLDLLSKLFLEDLSLFLGLLAESESGGKSFSFCNLSKSTCN